MIHFIYKSSSTSTNLIIHVIYLVAMYQIAFREAALAIYQKIPSLTKKVGNFCMEEVYAHNYSLVYGWFAPEHTLLSSSSKTSAS